MEIDSPTITPRSVLSRQRHVGEFNDTCQSVFRASLFSSDHLIEGLHPNPDTLNGSDLDS